MNGAVDAVQIVKRGVVKHKMMGAVEEDARGSFLLSCGVQALLEAETGLEIDGS